MARWTSRLDWREKLTWAPAQTPGLHAATGLTPADTDASAWALQPCGRWRRGAGAINVALDQLLPFGLPWFRLFYAVPGLRQIQDRAYTWVAANRHRLAGQAACALGRPGQLPEAVVTEIRRRVELGTTGA